MCDQLSRPTVVICLRNEKCDVYIGRKPNGMHFGNPFVFGQTPKSDQILVRDRAEAVRSYKQWLEGVGFSHHQQDRRSWILSSMASLRGKRLGCYCKPQACHGDVLVDMIERSNADPELSKASKSELRIMITGHRPPKIGGYNWNSPARKRLRGKLAQAINHILKVEKITTHKVTAITGMALGTDMDFAWVCKEHLNIPYECFIPGGPDQQTASWNEHSTKLYDHLLEHAEEVRCITDPKVAYSTILQRRNVSMVDSCTNIIGVTDGSAGGTRNCLFYAREQGFDPYIIRPHSFLS